MDRALWKLRHYTRKEPIQQKCHVLYKLISCPAGTEMQRQLPSTKINMEENPREQNLRALRLSVGKLFSHKIWQWAAVTAEQCPTRSDQPLDWRACFNGHEMDFNEVRIERACTMWKHVTATLPLLGTVAGSVSRRTSPGESPTSSLSAQCPSRPGTLCTSLAFCLVILK
jgi:hypothetical protein